MKYLKLPYFFIVYILYAIVRMFILLSTIVFAQIVEFGLFVYELIRYGHIIKEQVSIDFIGKRQIDLKGKIDEFLEIFTIEGF